MHELHCSTSTGRRVTSVDDYLDRFLQKIRCEEKRLQQVLHCLQCRYSSTFSTRKWFQFTSKQSQEQKQNKEKEIWEICTTFLLCPTWGVYIVGGVWWPIKLKASKRPHHSKRSASPCQLAYVNRLIVYWCWAVGPGSSLFTRLFPLSSLLLVHWHLYRFSRSGCGYVVCWRNFSRATFFPSVRFTSSIIFPPFPLPPDIYSTQSTFQGTFPHTATPDQLSNGKLF